MIAPVDITGVRIETERLILRPWQETDLADFYEYARVDGVGQMAGWSPHQSVEESAAILDSFIRHKKTFALELKENGKVIGSLGLEEREEELPVPENAMGREIGYVIGKDYWGRGLVPEAVKAVIDYCFKELDFDWLTCGHFVWNHRSRRVVEKSGFQYIRDIVHHTRFGTEELTKLYILENPDKIIRRMSAPVDPEKIHLETERLLLRPLLETDLEDIHEILSDKEVAEKTGFRWCENLEMSRKQMKEYIADRETVAVAIKETGKVIGTVSLQKRQWFQYPVDRQYQGREFGFDLNKAYWGRGLMPEAVKALTAHCFEVLGYDFVTAGHFRGNTQSARAIEKSGFRFLFEKETQIPNGEMVLIRTYIQYNPRKEISNV